jgi:hypothetical protein
MFEQIGNGFLGFFLVIGHWLSPGTDKPDIDVANARRTEAGLVVQCELRPAWNEELSGLVDGGIPLRFKFCASGNSGDTICFVRTLQFDVADYSYSYADSSVCGPPVDPPPTPKKYPQVLLALRDYCRWSFVVSGETSVCRIEAELLPSHATRLNRTVDMSAVWGQRKVVKVVEVGVRR